MLESYDTVQSTVDAVLSTGILSSFRPETAEIVFAKIIPAINDEQIIFDRKDGVPTLF